MAPDDDRAASPRDEEIPALFGAYALGALPAEERAAVEAYLAAHPEAQAEVAMLQDAAAMLPYSLDAAAPDQRVRLRLMAQVYQEALAETEGAQPVPAPTPIRQRPRGLLWPIAAAILLLFTVGFGGWAVSLRRDLSGTQATVAAQQTTVASASISTSPVQSTIPGTAMRGEVTKLGGAQAAVLTVSDMPPLASGKVYEVWFITGNTPTGAGTFTPNPDGSWSGLLHGDVNAAQKIAISIEPLGGSLAPTGAIVAQGSL